MKATVDKTCSHAGCKGKGTYMLDGRCSNCGWSGTVVLTRGHEGGRIDCPDCDCRTLRTAPRVRL